MAMERTPSNETLKLLETGLEQVTTALKELNKDLQENSKELVVVQAELGHVVDHLEKLSDLVHTGSENSLVTRISLLDKRVETLEAQESINMTEKQMNWSVVSVVASIFLGLCALGVSIVALYHQP